MEAPATTPAPGPSPGPTPIPGLAPDPALAEILRKHAAGTRLTPQEYGRLGAWKARASGLPIGRPKKSGAPPGSSAPAPALLPRLDPGAMAPGPAEIAGAPTPAVDPDLVRRTTAAILSTCDQAAKALIGNAARQAGADATTQKQFEEAAALQSGPRDLMVQTSPEVIASLGIDASNYPVAAFLSGLGIWAGSLGIAMAKLNTMAKERALARGQQEQKETKATKEAGAPAP